MKNTTINFIKIVFEKEIDEICKNKNEYKKDYIKDLVMAYQEFIKEYGEDIDGMILEYYKGRLGIKNEQ